MIAATDSDFRIAVVDLPELERLQGEAESNGFSTRWTSVEALRSQVADGRIILQSLLREDRGGQAPSYRCLALFRVAGDVPAGAVTTIDIEPTTYMGLDRIYREPEVRAALIGVFRLALAGVEGVSKV